MTRFVRWLRRGRFERDMQEEMQAHLERQAEALRVEGVDAAAALRRARMEFGRTEALQEACRESSGYRVLDAVRADVGYAWRQTRRQPLLAAAVVLTLGIGLGLSSGLFALVNAVVLRPPVEGPGGRFARVYSSYAEITPDGLNPMINTWRDYQAYATSPAWAQLAAWHPAGSAHVDGETVSDLTVPLFVSCNFFQVYGLEHAAAGRLLTPADCTRERAVVVVTDTLARQVLGRTDGVLGQSISFHGHALTVVGVVTAPFAGQVDQIGSGAWIPLPLYAAVTGRSAWASRPDEPGLGLDGRLAPRESYRTTSVALHGIAARQDREHGELDRHRLVLVTDGALIETPGVEGPARWGLTLAVFMITLVGLIAAANVAGLLLARAQRRRYEMAVRLTLGAGRVRLLRMLWTEVAGLASAAAILAWWLARLVPQWLAARFGGGQAFTLHALTADAHVLAYLGGLTVIGAMLAAASPAAEALRLDVHETLKGKRDVAVGGGRHRYRQVMTAAQVGLSLVLLIAAACFTLAQHDLLPRALAQHGYRATSVLAPTISYRGPEAPAAAAAGRRDALVAGLGRLPGVRGVGFSQFLPMAIGWRGLRIGGHMLLVQTNVVSPNYFALMNIPLVAGHGFGEATATCRTGVCPAVVSREFLRRYRGPQPAGLDTVLPAMPPMSGQAATSSLQIVGIAGDTTGMLDGRPEPVIYRAWDPNASGYRPLVYFEGPAAAAAAAVTTKLRRDFPGADVTAETLQQLAGERAQLVSHGMLGHLQTMLVVLGLGGIGLALLGLYGSFAFLLGRRTKEMGLRIAVGARPLDIYWLAVRTAMWPLGAGVAAGLMMYAVVAGVLQRLITGPGGLAIYFWRPGVMASGVGLVLAAGMAALWRPARRATRVDPAVALREE